ncbi:Gfo/Idh/MocA family protein [Paenibacillus radicis (ex Xue et al. 2023)]|uniref:Gfo/Idh/MocA family oxidoreductase n=1 Tax=Paenibacillus radicis (ex Xue et al. 2023) TaxID=2972489 RepID=A0ABT1YF89_9BACL|nr:Gfo/Idh/MocA family oxidoreductase [Paenibacillus radicis (ex Xue et al. 2023)]MCR8631587.1 Gfo/Idh/MocA family oxidoreductase [Paenibacillus radicis (ex Xue et al. 2023)]
MKAVLVGLGNKGYSWYKRIRRDHPHIQLAVVEVNAELQARLAGEPVPFYTSVSEAIEKERPDILINVTPPAFHSAVNELAFEHRLPVFCEKPISNNYEESVRIVELASQRNIPFMIAENYRCFPFTRHMKSLLEQGEIGSISTIQIDFCRYHPTDIPYFLALKNPLLEDVTIHHFDLIRYLTGQEAKSIYAFNYCPVGSWLQANVNLNFCLEMEDGIVVNYIGSMTEKGHQTGWSGDWRIEGTEGALLLIEDRLFLNKGEGNIPVDSSGIPDLSCFHHFLEALSEGRNAETCGEDYIKSEALVHFANQSHELQQRVQITS